ncbi:MFS transporter [Pseudonocardia lacus]|uniref:MFS transporter n=1 Tax=Pseudonocardia lacus TaxID=2835865 RepID=UPI001BDCB896|nr:MFS transporter [Pseudonocardia lacus]
MPAALRMVRSSPIAYVDNARLTRFHWVLLTGIVLAQILDGYELVTPSYALPGIGKDFALTAGALGLVGTIQNLGLLLGALIAGNLGDRVGRRTPLALAVTLYSIGALISGLAPNSEILILGRIIGGIGIGMQYPAIFTLIAEFVPVRYRSKAMPTMLFATGIGTVVGGLGGVFLIAPLGWRVGFLVGVLPIVLLLWVWRSCPESVRFLLLVGKTEQAHAVVQRIARSQGEQVEFVAEPVVTATAQAAPSTAEMGRLLRRHLAPLVGLTLTIFCINLSNFGAATWIPSLFIAGGATELRSYQLTLTSAVISTVLAVIVSMAFLDVGRERRFGLAAVCAFGAVCFGLFGVSFLLNWDLMIAVVLSALFAMAASAANVYYYTLATELFPTAVRSQAVAYATGFGRLGAVLGPVVLGLLLGALTVPTVIYIFAAPMLLASVFALTLIRGRTRNTSLEASSGDEALVETEKAPEQEVR